MAKSPSSSARTRAGATQGNEVVKGRRSEILQLHLLTETTRLFAAPLSLPAILSKLAALLAGNLDVSAVLLLLRDDEGGDFVLRAGRGVPRGVPRPARVSGDDPLVAPVGGGPRPLVAQCGNRDARWRRSRLRPLLPPRTGSIVALPMAVRERLLGLLVIAFPPGEHCTDEDAEWFLPIAEQVALALEKLQLTQRLEISGRLLEATVRSRTGELRQANRSLRGALAEIRELRRYSEQVVASLVSCLVTFDGEGKVISANPTAQAALHLGSASAEGQTLADLFGAEFAEALLRQLGRRQTNIARAQATIVVGAGEERVIGYSVSPLRRVRGGLSWILLFRDLTESKRVENEMRRLDRLVSLGEISANVAHELKNPLTVMYANMEWLLEKIPEEYRRRVQITIDHMERMEAIIARMGILSKDQPIASRPVDLAELVTQMISFVDKTLREKKIDVAIVVPPKSAWILGDPAQLQQALLNIIMNAAQAIGSNGRILVRLESRAERGRRGFALAVEDSGTGIPQHLLGKIFEPFFTTKETGTGLGLAITSQIVAAHDGRIEAENLPGGGARVSFWFPAVKAPPG